MPSKTVSFKATRKEGPPRVESFQFAENITVKAARDHVAERFAIPNSERLIFFVSGQVLNDGTVFAQLTPNQLPDGAEIEILYRPYYDLKSLDLPAAVPSSPE
jgi:hypothetical protein